MYTILIVDDDPSIRQATQAPLELLAGWKTLLAGSGREGLALAQEKQPDAILLDVLMPEMDGIMTLKHLQSLPATQSIPVILFTSQPSRVIHQTFAGLPITGIIHKPFDVTELIQQIRTFLNWDE